MSTIELWAEAIAARLSDEWEGSKDFPEDAKTLRNVLESLFLKHPSECWKLIGTGIIERDYFGEPDSQFVLFLYGRKEGFC